MNSLPRILFVGSLVLLGTFVSSLSAQAPAPSLPGIIALCEDTDGCADVVFQGKQGKGAWASGGIATITIVRIDESSVTLSRIDTEGTGKGIEADYTGTRTGDWVEGTLTAKWPGHIAGTASSKWHALILPPAAVMETAKTAKAYLASIATATAWAVCLDPGNACAANQPPARELWTLEKHEGHTRNAQGDVVTNGAYVDRFDATGLVMRSVYLYGPFQGMTGLFVGERQGSTMKGKVTWIWPGHTQAPLQHNWSAKEIPVNKCEQSSATKADIPALKTASGINDMLADGAASLRCSLIAAKLGDAEAQNTLANIYYYGTPRTPKDPHQAFLWFQKSAEQNNMDGIAALSRMYGLGEGTEKNLMLARYFADVAEWNKRRAKFVGMANVQGPTAPLDVAGNLLGYFLLGGAQKDKEFGERMTHEEAVVKYVLVDGMTRVKAEEKVFDDEQSDNMRDDLMYGDSCGSGPGPKHSGESESQYQDRARTIKNKQSDCADLKAETYAGRVAYLRCVQATVDSNAIEQKCTFLP